MKMKIPRSYSDLPEELIVNILSRLPVKSVGLCRCVSKPWRALLSRPTFIRNHLHRWEESLSLVYISKSDLGGALYSASLCKGNAHQLFDEITISPTKLSFPHHPDSWILVHASCDGLLLVEDDLGNMFVLNPLTRAIREVQLSPFALDHCERSIMPGFGRDAVSDDYKIVTLSFYGKSGVDCTETFVHIYSLKTGTWRMVESSFYWRCGSIMNPGVFVDGCIHWIACTGTTTDYESTIMAFDLSEEKFHEVPSPTSVGNMVESDNLVVLGGHLCTFNERETGIWMMKEYRVKESWTKTMMDVGDLDGYEVYPLCMLGQEEMVLVKDYGRRLVMCNLKEGRFKDIVGDGIAGSLFPEASFVESLVSPHILNS